MGPSMRHFWHMERTLSWPFEPGAARPGFITDFDPDNDLFEVNAVLSEALEDDRGYQTGRFQRWAAQEMRTRPTTRRCGKSRRSGDVPSVP